MEGAEDDSAAPGPVCAVVWRAQALGFAFIDESTVRFAQVADVPPTFPLLQSLKYAIKPRLFVVSSAEMNCAELLRALQRSEFLDTPLPDEAPTGPPDIGRDACDEYPIAACKSRDFTVDAARKRLSLMNGLLSEMAHRELTEREALLYVEHIVPREKVQALQAIGGLLAYLQKTDSAGVTTTALKDLQRYDVDNQLYVAPETFLSLNIFEDARHPSAHGGRGKEGFSIWGLMNHTKSKPGEQLLRSWFSQPTKDEEVLRSRFATVASFEKQHCLLSQLQELLAKTKDVTKIESSIARGGLLLRDYTNILSTTKCAVEVRDAFRHSDLPNDLPIVGKVHGTITQELAEVANLIASIINFEASKMSGRQVPGATKHICVREGVQGDLDELQRTYLQLPALLQDIAEYERSRLISFEKVHRIQRSSVDELTICYVPQLGFMLKLPNVSAAPIWSDVDLDLQFENEGECYCKTNKVRELDASIGDISTHISDVESHIVRLLEVELLRSLPALREAQQTLAELDALLSLASCARDMGLTRPILCQESAACLSAFFLSPMHALTLPSFPTLNLFENVLQIDKGFHPLLQQRVPQLVPNDCELGGAARLMLLTGPNASGKTVYLRTVGVIAYLAHVGSFVPAESARIGIMDGIFTRMHSKESSALNASAFMLDLNQMASMIKSATSRSLCLIDEFGKGTNAQDGIALLYACLRHFLDKGAECPTTLACTHYTELLDVPHFREQPGLVLWTMEVLLQPKTHADDTLDDVVFLHRATPGECTDSFGWHCAFNADLPEAIISRARYISNCRAQGEEIMALDADVERLQRRNELVTSIVDDFLEFDFGLHTADDFFAAQRESLTEWHAI
ncbi:hypothetical protein AB1Y20_003055 [Prymnesium parvum]|uniref:DNA mismatch repair proteins mutS family domain-containing protein n=1 Tax=Prymnesium parvum TaxID=97485 RepID=A0AB34JB42_PRYPA